MSDEDPIENLKVERSARRVGRNVRIVGVIAWCLTVCMAVASFVFVAYAIVNDSAKNGRLGVLCGVTAVALGFGASVVLSFADDIEQAVRHRGLNFNRRVSDIELAINKLIEK